MMEFDLRESSDGAIFLSHDATLDRTTTGSGTVASHTVPQLAKVFLRDPISGSSVEPINRFDDLLEWAATSPVALMVDLKDTPPADAVLHLRQYKLIDHAVLLTFDSKTTAAALASDPAALVSILVKSPQEIDAAIAEAKGHPIAFYIAGTADPVLFAYAHRSGHAVISDAMGDLDGRAQKLGPQVYREFLATHPIDILVTDHAQLLNAAFAGLLGKK
jgi:glycerophosphoryl diester phosphodiesterase